MPRILLAPGVRVGHGKLSAEPAFRQKLAEDYEVFTLRNGVYFSVTLNDQDGVVYRPLAEKPDGMEEP